jgi:hypothetical protein
MGSKLRGDGLRIMQQDEKLKEKNYETLYFDEKQR